MIDPVRAIPFAAALSAALHLRAEYAGPRWQVYLFKPLTTALVLLLAGMATSTQGADYQRAIAAGLACSVVGDVLLMLPRDRFITGLASFLAAHLAYLYAFGIGVPLASSPLLLLPLIAVTFALLRLLWAGLGALRLPVLIYALTLMAMVWRAWSRAEALPDDGTLLAAAGATLFMVSDSLLAIDRFHRPFRAAQAAIMSTYVAAQLLIARSVGAG